MINSNKPPVSFQENQNSDFCGSMPLNFINLIQPHGILLVVDKEEFLIVQASENVQQILGIKAEEVVQRTLMDFIGPEQMEVLQGKLQAQEVGNHLSMNFDWYSSGMEKPFLVTIHTKGTSLLFELEEIRSEEKVGSFISIYQEISYVISALKEVGTLTDLQSLVVSELKKLSGFDRIMVYKFDENWNGTVLAEAMEEGMTPYLGLRFPASDIPRQARELYFRTPYRMIPNVNAESVKFYPVINSLTSSLTDISECVLRAVPLVHIEYLQNMKVAASMSVPIIVDGRLWGLISCHHRMPKKINFELRSAFEIVSGIFSSQISAREKEESFQYQTALHKIERKLVEQLYTKPELVDSLFEKPSYLLDLLEVEGLVMVLDGIYETVGEVPDQKMVRNLVKWLNRYSREKVFATDSLPRAFSEAEKYREVASGLIALQISAGRHYILGFRPEVIKAVHWGGNPNEAIQIEEDGKRYHPRNSFNLWKEQVEYSSESWAPEVLEVAYSLRTSVLEKLIKENES